MRAFLFLALFALAACASLSHRPTDLQPAVVVPMEESSLPLQGTRFEDCLDRALSGSPGLVPQLAQNCCLRSGIDREVQGWCDRHVAMLRTDTVPAAYRADADKTAHWNWLREAGFCADLQESNLGPKAASIQCRISKAMRNRIGK